jgi:Endoplasmic Reticulum Oxidoreductin 1 (ERO1)
MILLSLLSLLPYSGAWVTLQPRSIQYSRHNQENSRISFSVRNAISAISNNEDLLPGIAAINRLNDELNDKLTKICDQLFFRLFSVDILASCEYMPQELFECYTETCEIYPVDEDEVRKNCFYFCHLFLDPCHT